MKTNKKNNHFISYNFTDDYTLLTFLNRAEIISVFMKFQKLDPISVEENRNVRLTVEQVLSGVDELRLNPFGDRICQAFAAENDGKMGFEDFLDMYSVMSDAATPEIKMHFAFNAYDFDADGVIGRDDLTRTVDRFYRTNHKRLTDSERKKIVDKLLEETDVDKDGVLCKPEFKYAICRSPDFFDHFQLRI